MTLAYVRLADGTPIGRTNCDLYAWHSDAELVPHLWDVLQMEGVEVRLVLGEPVPSWSVRSRKLLGRSCAITGQGAALERLAPRAEPVADAADGLAPPAWRSGARKRRP